MPAEYTIDKSKKMVFSVAHGILTDQDAFSHQDKLRNDPDFDPSFWQLADFTDVSQTHVSTNAVRILSERNPFGDGSRRAFVAPQNITYGLSRMFQILTYEFKDELHVYRDMLEARKFLMLEEL